jgi:hypothetical protein
MKAFTDTRSAMAMHAQRRTCELCACFIGDNYGERVMS